MKRKRPSLPTFPLPSTSPSPLVPATLEYHSSHSSSTLTLILISYYSPSTPHPHSLSLLSLSLPLPSPLPSLSLPFPSVGRNPVKGQSSICAEAKWTPEAFASAFPFSRFYLPTLTFFRRHLFSPLRKAFLLDFLSPAFLSSLCFSVFPTQPFSPRLLILPHMSFAPAYLSFPHVVFPLSAISLSASHEGFFTSPYSPHNYFSLTPYLPIYPSLHNTYSCPALLHLPISGLSSHLGFISPQRGPSLSLPFLYPLCQHFSFSTRLLNCPTAAVSSAISQRRFSFARRLLIFYRSITFCSRLPLFSQYYLISPPSLCSPHIIYSLLRLLYSSHQRPFLPISLSPHLPASPPHLLISPQWPFLPVSLSFSSRFLDSPHNYLLSARSSLLSPHSGLSSPSPYLPTMAFLPVSFGSPLPL
ncbi:hypothetical protein C7M84_021430 [Penaeus vannamei]|uniref:Uncharacterized protein n=1 Tax=Penaeus vannamei TaxID=6689 RepID=A0A423S9R4_PENVA|nr:hypothetical protein C7M84_021430 [Penaeus vannamei]